jgi:hypothetical protein
LKVILKKIDLVVGMRSRNSTAKRGANGWNMKNNRDIGSVFFKPATEIKQPPLLPEPLLKFELPLTLELHISMAESII